MGIISEQINPAVQDFIFDTIYAINRDGLEGSSYYITGLTFFVGVEAVGEIVDILVSLGYLEEITESPFFILDLEKVLDENPEITDMFQSEGSERFEAVVNLGKSIIKAQDLYFPIENIVQEPTSSLILP